MDQRGEAGASEQVSLIHVQKKLVAGPRRAGWALQKRLIGAIDPVLRDSLPVVKLQKEASAALRLTGLLVRVERLNWLVADSLSGVVLERAADCHRKIAASVIPASQGYLACSPVRPIMIRILGGHGKGKTQASTSIQKPGQSNPVLFLLHICQTNSSNQNGTTYVQVMPNKGMELLGDCIRSFGGDPQEHALNLMPTEIVDVLHEVEDILGNALRNRYQTIVVAVELEILRVRQGPGKSRNLCSRSSKIELSIYSDRLEHISNDHK